MLRVAFSAWLPRTHARLLLLALVVAGSIAGPGMVAPATAATDVVIAFDTTGSMDGALDEAKAQVQSVIGEVGRRFGDVQFAVAAVNDYPGLYGDGYETPWTLVQPMTADQGAIQAAIDGLSADGGGDGPEAYGRALQEADSGTDIGFRPGSQRLLVLVADNVPHDDDLNEGVPAEAQAVGSPFDTGVDPGRDEEPGTSDDIDWQQQLALSKAHGIPLYFVLFKGDADYLPYWQAWAGQTGGSASTSEDGALGTTLVQVISAGAGGCARAYERVGVLDVCADAIADRGDGTKRATGGVRIAGGVDAGGGPVVIDPAAQTIASEGAVPLGVVRGSSVVPFGTGAFTIQAGGVKDDVSGRERLADMTFVGADLSSLHMGGLGLVPGGKTYIDPADGGGILLAARPPFDLLGQGPLGTLAVGLHSRSATAFRVLGGSAGWDAKLGTSGWGVKGSLEYDGAEDTWKLKGEGSFPKVLESLEVSGALRSGKIDAIGLKVTPREGGVPLGTSGFFFDSLAGEVSGLAKGPMKIKVGVTGGYGAEIPVIKKHPINLEKADVSVATNLTGSIEGRVGLVDRRLAGGDLDVDMALSPFHASGRLNADVALLGTGFYARAGIDMTSKHFTASGSAELRVAGHTMQSGSAIISDEGAGASGKACGICPVVGAGIRWRDAFSFPPKPEWIGADVERYRTVKASSAAQRRRTQPLRVARGTAVLAVYATPRGGAAADVELRGPGGRRVRLGAPGPLASVDRTDDGRLGFTVLNPRAGRWVIVSAPGVALESQRVPPVGTLARVRVSQRGTKRRPLRRGVVRVRWRVQGRLPRGARVAVQASPTARGGGVTLATAPAKRRGAIVPVRSLPRGASRLSLVITARGVPFRRLPIAGAVHRRAR